MNKNHYFTIFIVSSTLLVLIHIACLISPNTFTVNGVYSFVNMFNRYQIWPIYIILIITAILGLKGTFKKKD